MARLLKVEFYSLALTLSDNTLSLAVSNLFFLGNEVMKWSAKDEDKKYWLQSTEEYNDVVEDGPEVSPSMASTTKILWEKPFSADKLKSKTESGKLPTSCRFMKIKQCNTKVWVTLGKYIWSQDYKFQKVKMLLEASASYIMQVFSVWSLLNNQPWTHLMLKPHWHY